MSDNKFDRWVERASVLLSLWFVVPLSISLLLAVFGARTYTQALNPLIVFYGIMGILKMGRHTTLEEDS